MRWCTKNSRGSVDLVLALPIFFLILWGVTFLFLRMIHQSRLETAGWTYAIARGHGEAESSARRKFERGFFVGNPGEKVRWSHFSNPLGDAEEVVQGMNEPLPESFRTYVLAHRPIRTKICAQSDLSEPSLQEWDDEGIAVGCDGRGVFFRGDLKVEMRGTDFSRDPKLRALLEAEAMTSAGFPYLSAQLLGVPELAQIWTGVAMDPSK